MQAYAIAKGVRVSPYKIRQILPLIRGKKVSDAMLALHYTPKKAARIVEKVLKSAVANAEFNFGMDIEKLKVSEAKADQGPSMKRFRPVSMGRAHAYVHRTSHITVTVAD